jgi:hypothetical protein
MDGGRSRTWPATGRLYVVVAADRDGVIALMKHEDEKARVPEHLHRNSG